MRILAVIGALTIIFGIGAAVYFLAGFYSVAGTAEDPAIVNWALVRVRTASINRHAQDQLPASINAPGSVEAGAKAFAAHGCATCHGAPGVNWAKFSEGLHPDPPDLKDVVGELSPAQLFWVIPVLRGWSNLWFYVGIAGTVILIILWLVAVPASGHPIDANQAAIEGLQIIFILSGIVIVKDRTKLKVNKENV